MTLTYNEFFLRLDELASSKGVTLPFSTKDFFFHLVHYCELNGSYDYETSMYIVEGSVRFFNTKFQMHSCRLVQEAISILSDIGLIKTSERTPLPTFFYVNFPYVELVQKGVV